MKVALTGATGFIGSHVLTDLQKHGHEVTALVRDDTRAETVAARGAKASVVDLCDRSAVASLLRNSDGAIHTASPGDATTADMDSAVTDAVIEAFAGTGKPYIEISGMWVYGDNTAITEESAFHAPALVTWKERIERRVLGARGMRPVVIVSSTVYGDGGAADLADCFRRVLEDDSARGRYVIGNGVNSTVAGREARGRLNDSFTEVLLLDQGTDAAKARAELGWHPSHPSLVDEFRHGSYRK